MFDFEPPKSFDDILPVQANVLGLLKSNVGPCVVSLISDNIRVTANEV